MTGSHGQIVVITGPPGAGKTTITSLVADRFPQSVHIVADCFWEWIRSGYVQPWLAESAEQNQVTIEALATAAGRYATGGYTVLVDGIVGPWFIDAFVDIAATNDVSLHYVILRPDASTALARATARDEGALVDPEPVEKMYLAFEALGRYEDNVIDSTGLGQAATADAVLSGITTGRFVI